MKSGLRNKAGWFCRISTRAGIGGRKRRSARPGVFPAAPRLQKPGRRPVFAETPARRVSDAASNRGGSIRNESGRCDESRTGVPARSEPNSAVNRPRVSEN
jgi:hypothetical protein